MPATVGPASRRPPLSLRLGNAMPDAVNPEPFVIFVVQSRSAYRRHGERFGRSIHRLASGSPMISSLTGSYFNTRLNR